MRFIAPVREAIDTAVFARPPLSDWATFGDLLTGLEWPALDALNAQRPPSMAPRFVAQTRELEVEKLHYELRIEQRGEISTRERNWHDLLNALIWMRYPALKAALNARQVSEIAIAGTKARTRAQYALTHFDEAGVIVVLGDTKLLSLWDAHDWHGLFWRERDAWIDGRLRCIVFGHALLEHALRPSQLLVGKGIGVIDRSGRATDVEIVDAIANHIGSGFLLNDPQDLRPLPLSGLPGWSDHGEDESFYRSAACFQPMRDGRIYPDAVIHST